MRNIPQDIITALNEGIVKPLFLVEIEFDTSLLFSSAFEQVVFGGKTYIGAGNMSSIGSPSENTDLDPQQIEVKVSGVSTDNLEAIGNSNYLNRDATVWVCMLGEEGEILGDTSMVYFKGKTDDVKFDYGKVSSINIMVRDRLSDWSRQKLERNMNSDHQAKYPGDLGFEFVAQISAKKIIWPKGEYYE